MKESYLLLETNPGSCSLSDIPVIDYVQFYQEISNVLQQEPMHIAHYFCVPVDNLLRFYCMVADDTTHQLRIYAHQCQRANAALESLTAVHQSMHIFEREMHENFGVDFPGHPWLKPVRWPHNRANQQSYMDDYPFFKIDSPELHEVGVGPVHAGVIEPGHFRFICNGEKVYHLEIHLGYQHRGVESLYTQTNNLLHKSVLSEQIAGDTAVGHALCFSQLIEKASGVEVSEKLQLERVIALELERIAVHIGDTAALCGDIAYQLGQVVCESLRTVVINTTQYWCGNRFGKGCIRPGGTHYPMSDREAEEILHNLEYVERRYEEMAAHLYSMPGALSRFDGIGTVTRTQGIHAGLTGMAARMTGIERDIRSSHPFQFFKSQDFKPVVFSSGDVLARALLRRSEIHESIELIRRIIQQWKNNFSSEDTLPNPDYTMAPTADCMTVSMVEGWRGEIVHVAITNEKGSIVHYKVKDPSLHNWFGLALAVRNQEISDFPVCNKSFNLSYCGYDL